MYESERECEYECECVHVRVCVCACDWRAPWEKGRTGRALARRPGDWCWLLPPASLCGDPQGRRERARVVPPHDSGDSHDPAQAHLRCRVRCPAAQEEIWLELTAFTARPPPPPLAGGARLVTAASQAPCAVRLGDPSVAPRGRGPAAAKIEGRRGGLAEAPGGHVHGHRPGKHDGRTWV